jgi:hypothetical protein
MSFLTINKSKKAINIGLENSKMIVFLEDERELSIPLEWFPRLRKAIEEQLNKWRLIGKGEEIHGVDIDEDILVENLFE